MKTYIYFYHISLTTSENDKFFSQTLHRKSKHTFYAQ